MAGDAIPTIHFVKIVVRQGDSFLLVHERKFGQTWHLPAGRAMPGEALVQAALRETQEETGVPLVLDGIIRVEHSPHPDKAFLGVIFLGHPAADVPPKTTPDEESLGAAWFTVDEAARLPLREDDVLDVLRYVRQGGPVCPLGLLAPKGTPYLINEPVSGTENRASAY